MNNPKISIIVPCRNEKAHIHTFVSSILAQKGTDDAFEIIIADGLSDDGTREILDQLSIAEPRLRVIENPKQIVSTGLNAALKVAKGKVIIRMDTHTVYSTDYVKKCCDTLASTGADNVGGPWQAKGKTWLQKAIAVAFQSSFSSGGGGAHRVGYEGVVDTVYLGCWQKETFRKIGYFDEELVRNQDDELNLRLVRSGGTVWQSPSIQSWYYPRSSLLSLFKQYMQYGYWKVLVIKKHKIPASFRHVIPGGFVGVLLALGMLSLGFTGARYLLLSLLLFYVCINFLASLVTCRSSENRGYIFVMPIIFGAFHFGYGWGFLRGTLDFLIFKRGGGINYGKLTR